MSTKTKATKRKQSPIRTKVEFETKDHQPVIPGLEPTTKELKKVRKDIAGYEEELKREKAALRKEAKELMSYTTLTEERKQLKALRETYTKDQLSATAVRIVEAEATAKRAADQHAKAKQALSQYSVVQDVKSRLNESRAHLDVVLCDMCGVDAAPDDSK